jgi:hypothetical protein
MGMELPFLKNRANAGGGGPTEKLRASDDGSTSGSDLMDQVADEFLQAIEKKDKGLLRDALKALVLHINDEDEVPPA